MIRFLLQVDGLSEIQRAVRDHFQKGGSGYTVLLVLLGMAGAVFLASYLTRRQRKRKDEQHRTNPGKLYRDLLEKLGVPSEQRRLLNQALKENRLEQPAVLLLCPRLFDRFLASHWPDAKSISADSRAAPKRETVAQLRETLFAPDTAPG